MSIQTNNIDKPSTEIIRKSQLNKRITIILTKRNLYLMRSGAMVCTIGSKKYEWREE